MMNRPDLEPDGIHGRQEHQRQDCSCQRAANQCVGQRSPEHRMGERDERKNRRQRRQDHWSSALYGGFDNGTERVQALLFVMVDLPNQYQRVAH